MANNNKVIKAINNKITDKTNLNLSKSKMLKNKTSKKLMCIQV